MFSTGKAWEYPGSMNRWPPGAAAAAAVDAAEQADAAAAAEAGALQPDAEAAAEAAAL
jgi:hypothetical protein